MTFAAAYIRVSSEMQVDVGASLPSQLSAIREFAVKNGYEIPAGYIYSDEGISARSTDRPEFQRMIAEAKTDPLPFQAIICYENSRFARSREDAVLFKAMLRRRGIKLHFVKQDFDDSPAGRMLEGIIESVDQWYSENLAVETKRGQIQNAKDGFSTGGRPPYGLRRVEVKNEHGAAKAKWEPDPKTSKVVQRIYDMYGKGSGYKAIAQALNTESIPSPSDRAGTRTRCIIFCIKKPAGISWPADLWARKRKERIRGRKYVPKDEWTINRDAWGAIITEEQASMASAKAGGTVASGEAKEGII